MKKSDGDGLEKLMKLTKLMKKENVQVAPKGPPKASNKWRGQAPKFAPKEAKAPDLVEGGGMQVDPSLKAAYDAWRQDKIAEQKDRRAQSERRTKAAKEARAAERNIPPSSSNA